MVTIKQIETTGIAAASMLGYTAALNGTRLNGNGTTSFLWGLSKDGKKYLMENAVVLKNVNALQLPLFANVFEGDMKNMVEVTP